MKRDVADNNTTFKIANIKRLASDATDRISQETISKTIKHAEKIQIPLTARTQEYMTMTRERLSRCVDIHVQLKTITSFWCFCRAGC